MYRSLAIALCLALPACSTDPPADGGGTVTELEPHVMVNGVPTDFGNADVLLCAEDLPDVVQFTLMRRGSECPEQTAIGGSGDPISRGRICEEIYVRVADPVVDRTVDTVGSPSALLIYSRHTDPPLSLSTGDTGPGLARPEGSITLQELYDRDGTYVIRFNLEIRGDDLVNASGGFAVDPRFCTSA